MANKHKQSSNFTPCPPYTSFGGQLNVNLRQQLPNIFAGIIVGDDGTLQVSMTVHDPLLAEIIANTEQATSSIHPPVKIIVGSKHSLAFLDDLTKVITSRYNEFRARGIFITQYGPNQWVNKVGIGVKDLTPAITAVLEQEFGADAITTFESDVHLG